MKMQKSKKSTRSERGSPLPERQPQFKIQAALNEDENAIWESASKYIPTEVGNAGAVKAIMLRLAKNALRRKEWSLPKANEEIMLVFLALENLIQFEENVKKFAPAGVSPEETLKQILISFLQNLLTKRSWAATTQEQFEGQLAELHDLDARDRKQEKID